MKIMNNIFKNKKDGFTLIETMVALTIITFAILGPVSLATYSIKASTLSKNNVIASFLAQDAMEYIRNWRDSNYLQGEGDWLYGIKGGCVNPNGCYVDTTLPYDSGGAINNCGGGGCDFLKYDNVLKEYNHASGEDTIFRRKYRIREDVNDQEATILITISWDDGAGTRSFEVEDHIFNWRQ